MISGLPELMSEKVINILLDDEDCMLWLSRQADNFKTKLKSIGAGIQHGKAPFHFISPIARETFIGIIKYGSLADLRRLQVNLDFFQSYFQ